MDVIVIDVPDAWGMLMPRKWDETLGGSIQMDLSYATILIGDGSYVTLYNHPVTRNHVDDPRNRDDWSENEFEGKEICARLHRKDHCDKPYEACKGLIGSHLDLNPSQELAILPFAQEDSIDDMVSPKREDYKEQLMRYEGKDLGSLTILNQGNEGTLLFCNGDQKIIALIKSYPPAL
jgi:hypothetical protein